MAWYVIYQSEDGRIVSSTNNPDLIAPQDVLDARGYAVATITDGSETGIWNAISHTFDPAPPAPVYLSADQFLDLFTASEVDRCYSSTNLQLKKLLKRIEIRSDPLDLNAATIAQGLQLIAGLGLFDDQNGTPGAPTARPAAILAWRP